MTATTVAVEDVLDWDVFTEKYWDKAPVLSREVGSAPCTAAEALSAAVTGCTPAAGDLLPESVQLMTRNRRYLRANGRVPLPTDADFGSYAKRMTATLGGGKHALIVPGFHAHDPDLWDREREFFRPLWERVGLPMTTAITTLFHGDYDHSPVGVHKDRFATFMYVLSGRKRMRMWPSRPWNHDASTIVDYAQYVDGSIAGEAEAGQLLYWPSSYFHVGENLDDEPATSVNIGIPREGRRTEYEIGDLIDDVPVTEMIDIDAYLATRMPAIDTDPFANPGPGLPEPLRQGLAAAGAVLERSWQSERRAAVTLNRYTAGGFLPVPDPAPAPALSDSIPLWKTPRASIMWYRLDADSALCSGNGRLAEARPSAPVLAGLLDRLDRFGRRSPPRLGELLDPVPAAERDRCRQLISDLCRFRALAVGE